ncbi:CHAT domain-containing protein [Kamptonema formosum]|uniref:CHAT domain-containing protein n=1 Tax=Kamptonema formosum TaxID=331992 RepID=UPI00034C9EC7|nr:CHAT domain-containing protein [Oscillatoria sp. PCC 10802]
MTQELEFHISVTPVGADDYLVRTERVAPGVPLAEEQVTWPVEQWLAVASQLMNNPLLGLLQEGAGPTYRDKVLPASREGANSAARHEKPDSDTGQRFSAPDAAGGLNLVAVGRELYNFLFQGTLRDSWMTARGIAQNRGQVLRLRLGLKGNRLPRLPWEVLYAGERPIATGTDVAFSRYQPAKTAAQSFGQSKDTGYCASTLQILMVLSAPTDLESLELKREALHLQEELQRRSLTNSMGGTQAMQLTVLEQPDRNSLTQALEEGQYQVFHYAGHSNLGAAGGELYLVSRKTGLTETLNGDDLAGLLANNGIQLAVFNSCHSAHTPISDATVSAGERNLAEALVKRGIPAVLAMAESIPDDVALTLAKLFYRNLDRGYPVDLSLSRARQGLISAYGSNQLYWALPILYLQPEFDGYLTSNYRTAEQLSSLAEAAEPPASRLSRSPVAPEFPELSALDLAEVEDIYQDLAYEDVAVDEAPAVVSDFLRQLINPAPGSDDPGAAPPSDGFPLPEEEQQALEPEIYRQRPDPKPGDARRGSAAPAREVGNGYRKRGKTNFSVLSCRRSVALVALGVLGATAVGLLGVWAFREQIFPQPEQPPALWPPGMFAPPLREDSSADLNKGTAPQVVASAIAKFRKGDMIGGQLAVEALLDRVALLPAKVALDAVPKQRQDDPAINFLKGRLAWQFVQAGTPDRSLDSPRTYWERAVEKKPNSPLYYNALGFALYAEGNLKAASDAWFQVVRMPQASGELAPPAPDEKQQLPRGTPSVASRDVLTAYAGLALVRLKSARTQSGTEKQFLLSKAVKFQQMVMAQDPVNFQLPALAKNWMWSPQAIADWQSLQQLKR